MWAHFCKTSGEKRALFSRKNKGKDFVILLSFCDLVHVQSVILPKSLATSWTCTKSPKYGQNHKNTGVLRAIYHKGLYIRACLYLHWRCGHTGPQTFIMGTFEIGTQCFWSKLADLSDWPLWFYGSLFIFQGPYFQHLWYYPKLKFIQRILIQSN